MFDTLQGVLFFAFATITFLSYQSIPRNIGAVEDANPLVRHDVFTLFVRVCGLDHLVMAVGMVGMSFGVFHNHDAVAWTLVISAAIVAAISAMSAVVIRKAAR